MRVKGEFLFFWKYEKRKLDSVTSQDTSTPKPFEIREQFEAGQSYR